MLIGSCSKASELFVLATVATGLYYLACKSHNVKLVKASRWDAPLQSHTVGLLPCSLVRRIPRWNNYAAKFQSPVLVHLHQPELAISRPHDSHLFEASYSRDPSFGPDGHPLSSFLPKAGTHAASRLQTSLQSFEPAAEIDASLRLLIAPRSEKHEERLFPGTP
jgi:hypothetical protein